MTTVEWAIQKMERWAPPAWAESYDNVGLLVGDRLQPIKKVLVALDASDAVIEEAAANNCDMIIAHHPIIRDPLKNITEQDAVGRKIYQLILNRISLYVSHTNLDKAKGGVNDCLVDKLRIKNSAPLIPEAFDVEIGIGRFGELSQETTLENFINHTKKSLSLDDVRYSGDLKRPVKKIAVCGGSGMSFLQHAIDQKCDVYVTGDIRYHDAAYALEAGLTLVDITHYSGENIVVPAIISRLAGIAEAEQQAVSFVASYVNGQTFKTM